MQNILLSALFLTLASVSVQAATPIKIPAGQYGTSWTFTDRKGPDLYTFRAQRGQWVRVSPGECSQEVPCFTATITAPSGARVRDVLPETGTYKLRITTINDQYSKDTPPPERVEVHFQILPRPPLRTRITAYEEGADYPGSITTPYGQFDVPADEQFEATEQLIRQAVDTGMTVCVTPWTPYVEMCN